MFETLMWVTLGGVVGFLWGVLVGWCHRPPPEHHHWIACRREDGRPGLVLVRGGRHE